MAYSWGPQDDADSLPRMQTPLCGSLVEALNRAVLYEQRAMNLQSAVVMNEANFLKRFMKKADS